MQMVIVLKEIWLNCIEKNLNPCRIDWLKVTAQEREDKTTMKAKTYLINCNYPQKPCPVKILIVQMRNI